MEASENACLKSEIESAKVNEIQFRLATLKEERQQARLHGEETEFGPHGGCPMWASMLLRYCLAWSSVLQVIHMFLHSPSFSVVSPQEISGLEVSACNFFWKPVLVRVHGNGILWIICGICVCQKYSMLFKLFQSNAQQYEIYCGVLVPCASTITVQCRADGGQHQLPGNGRWILLMVKNLSKLLRFRELKWRWMTSWCDALRNVWWLVSSCMAFGQWLCQY